MKHLHSYALYPYIPLIMWGTSIFSTTAQENKEHELKLNQDAIKMIQFDFSQPTEQINKPLDSPIQKKWMDFRTDIKLPRSLTDTTTVKKIIGYVRAEPYTIWTKFGEDPVYDVLVTGRPKEWKMYWTLNPFRSKEEYGHSLPVMPGITYARMMGPIGPSASISGDINGFLYDVLTPRGRMLAHNRKHANAWKTYKDYKPTREDSLKFPNFIRTKQTSSIPGITGGESALSTSFDEKPVLPVYRQTPEENDSLKKSHADTLTLQKDSLPPKAQSGDNVSDWYKEMEQRKKQDSIRRIEFFRKDRIQKNQYDVEKQLRMIKDRQQ